MIEKEKLEKKINDEFIKIEEHIKVIEDIQKKQNSNTKLWDRYKGKTEKKYDKNYFAFVSKEKVQDHKIKLCFKRINQYERQLK
jgi:hypothetical protein